MLVEQDNLDKIRLKPVLDYLENHLTDRIQVEDACRIAKAIPTENVRMATSITNKKARSPTN